MATNATNADDVRTGTLAAIAAYTFWGFFPIYFLLIKSVAPTEVLAHRIIWAVPFGALIIVARKQVPDVLAGLRDPKVLRTLFMTAAVIALNWLIYIFAVQNGRIFEASLGYYINPLIYVVLGVVVLKEGLRRGQKAAVALATIGVLILTVYGGQFPALSLTLAVSFTIYGYLRKRVNIGAMPGLFIETLLLAPFAIMYLGYLTGQGSLTFLSEGAGLVGLLLLSGPFTVIPLLMFAIGARRLTLATLGFLQFIGPTLQFVVGLLSGEPFTLAHQLCFGFIWGAAAVYALDAWQNRAPAKPAA